MRELVWAKMKGFSPWPGIVSTPPPALKKAPKRAKCIFFFGSCNYAWIEEENIKPYLEYKERLIKSNKSAAFKDAVDRIDEYIKDPEKYKSNAEPPAVVEQGEDNDEAFDKLRENDNGEREESSIVVSTTPASAKKKTPKKKAVRSSMPWKFKIDKDVPKLTPITVKKRSRELSQSVPKRKRYSIGDLKSISDDNNLDNIDNLDNLDNLDNSYTVRRNFAAAQLLNRPALATRPEPPEIDMNDVSQTLKLKNINPSTLKFGFLGLGIMGSGIVKNLINSGHKVVVWNRTQNKCRKFEEAGAEVAQAPCDVIDQVDITFSCVADPAAAKEMVFGNCGILSSDVLSDGKGYVEMTGIDGDTSQDIADAIISRGGRYLEAQIQGSKQQAEEGTLIILAAGDRTLFDDCQTCFEAMGKNSFYLGDVGNASKMYLVLQMISGLNLAALAEGMALADRAGLQQKDVLEVLEITNIASPMILEKGNAIIKGDYTTKHPLLHMQKDLKLALSLSETIEQPLPLTATANELYKHAKRNGYSEHDSSAVYIRSRI